MINAPEGSINGCNYIAIISAHGIEHTFEHRDNVIVFTPTETDTVRYSCWMGMIYGNILVTDSSAGDAAENGTVLLVPYYLTQLSLGAGSDLLRSCELFLSREALPIRSDMCYG